MTDIEVVITQPIIEVRFESTMNGVGAVNWGSIGGILSNQTDLQAALDAKQNALGFTPENSANKTTDINGNSSSYPNTPTVKSYVDSVASGKMDIAAQRTGSAIAFDAPANYGTVASPSTGNITGDYTNARIGVTQLLIHNDSAAPTIPATWVAASGSSDYELNNDNYIVMEWISGTKVVYSIIADE